MSVYTNTLIDFSRRLDELLELEASEVCNTQIWQARAYDFIAFVKSNTAALDRMDGELWHYLSDIDVRMKDEEYADTQRKYVTQMINGLRREVEGQRDQ